MRVAMRQRVEGVGQCGAVDGRISPGRDGGDGEAGESRVGIVEGCGRPARQGGEGGGVLEPDLGAAGEGEARCAHLAAFGRPAGRAAAQGTPAQTRS